MKRTYRVAPILLLVFAGAAPVQLPPHPIEIEAHPVFRESFIAVMERQPGQWRLQPTRPHSEPPFASQDMHWRRINDNALVFLTYWRYSSSADASLALQYHRKVISVATRDVKGLADEAFEPAGSRVVIFRRGSFMFRVSTRSLNTDLVRQPSATIALSKAFLDASDRVVIDADAR